MDSYFYLVSRNVTVKELRLKQKKHELPWNLGLPSKAVQSKITVDDVILHHEWYFLN